LVRASVIIPCHDAARFLRVALASVQAQSMADLEVLAVDDHSTDDTASILQDAASDDPRIRPLRNAGAGGAGPARNVGLDHARGDHVAFLDADDAWHPEKLARQLAFMDRTRAKVSYTDYRGLLPDGRLGGAAGVPASLDGRQLLRDTAIGCSTVVVRREVLGDDRFPALQRRQDLALWLTLLRRVDRAHGLQEVLTAYRTGHVSVSSDRGKAARDSWRVMRAYAPASVAALAVSYPWYAWHAYRRKRRLATPDPGARWPSALGGEAGAGQRKAT
jgi:teichuronic acid biosynthesis glycosyltransferase TuaG